MIELAKQDLCTGCGACAFVCPKQCIVLKENTQGIIYPEIEDVNCISCMRCQKVCPIISPVSYHKPIKAYAAWSSDVEERRTSASGGVAAEVYKDALEKQYLVAGAVMNDDFSVCLELTNSKKRLEAFKNSKYVFSSAMGIYSSLRDLLANSIKVVVIGLPCQIAAIRKVFKDNENLLLLDVVCHGVTPYRYLIQHIRNVESNFGKVTKKVLFRDPNPGTHLFTFTLYDSDSKLFYAKRTKDGDTYQYGYHRMVTYRENCYHCAFAREERISDITLSDYKGLGKLAPCSYNNLNVSSVLVNTKKGQDFIEELIYNNKVIAEERPVREPVLGDAQLRHPSLKSKARIEFEKRILEEKGDFEKAIELVMAHELRRARIINICSLPKRIIRKVINIVR